MAQYAQVSGGSGKPEIRVAQLEAQLATEKALSKRRGEKKKTNKPTEASANTVLEEIMATDDLEKNDAALIDLAEALSAQN